MVEEEEQDEFNQLMSSKDSRRPTGPRHQRRHGEHTAKQPPLDYGFQLQSPSRSTCTVGSGESHSRTPAMPDLQALLDETTRRKGRATLDDFKSFKGELRRSQGATNEETKMAEGSAIKKKKKKEEEEEEDEVKNSRCDTLAVGTKESDEIQSEPVPLQPQGHEKLVKVDTSLKPTSNAEAEDDVLDTNDKKQQLDDQMALSPQPQRSSAEASTGSGNSSHAVKPEPAAPTPDKAALSAERMERKPRAVVREFLHLNDYKELQFVQPNGSAARDAPSPTVIVPEELMLQLERLLQEDVTSNQHILDWIEANVEEPQRSSPTFLRALMTAVCKAAVKADKPRCPVDTFSLKRRMPVLQKYLSSDAGKQLQALYALQALSDTLSQPPRVLQMFFDFLYKWKLISSQAFDTWQTSSDPAEQQGKAVALKAVKPFLTFLSGFRGDEGTRN